MTTRLYHHKTNGGAEYLCLYPVDGTDEGDLRSAIIRLDGEPELINTVKSPSDDEIRTEIFLWVEELEGNGLIITDTDLLQDTLKNSDMDTVRELFGVTS